MSLSASSPTYLNLPAADPESVQAEIAILGIPFGVPYPAAEASGPCAEAPAAIRQRSSRLASFVSHHDFDTGAPMLPRPERVVDCGDVPGDPSDGPGNSARAEATVRTLLDQGVVPVILGGDDSVPIPVLAAYADRGPVTVLQVDAHLDFRDEVHGVTRGYSSTMRRASEMAHVARIVQVGLRGVGSARTSDVGDARAAGGLLVTAREVRERGVGWVLEQLPAGASVFISFDLDGLDPSLCPAVSAPAPGGLSWDEAGDLLSGTATRCRVVGAALTELVPERDRSGYSALVAARLGIRLLSAIP
jgi:agmatinase